jgi:hypothetical protein
MRKTLKEVLNCCEVLDKARLDFKERFVREFYGQVVDYVQKTWAVSQKGQSLTELKKLLVLLSEFWRSVKETVKDSRMLECAIGIHRQLMEKYQEEMVGKIDSCFTLKEEEILDRVNVEYKGETDIIERMDNFFLSNSIYRQFHIDIRLVLYDFHDMPVHELVLQEYLSLFRRVFRHITEQTFKRIDQWKNPQLILGTCNEIEFIKYTFFEEMEAKLSRDYKAVAKGLRQGHIRELEQEISNTEILLVKNLFVLTFSTIDRDMLSCPFDRLSLPLICDSILSKLNGFEQINKYVKRNIFEASFEEICYFYYTSLIKFNREQAGAPRTADFFAKKIAEDIRVIQRSFEQHLHRDKIYAHLKDLTLLREFVQCDLAQLKKVCQSLKKEFGNSFSEAAVANLLSLRDMAAEHRESMAHECGQILKQSGESCEDISLVSSSAESFLDNWNNARSRKSTLTISINEFYESQHTIHQNKYSCSVWKQGYLFKKKITQHSTSSETRAFFQINHTRLEQYESDNQEEIMKVFELSSVRKCGIHPDKHYIFIVEFPDFKLQFKAETSDEAKEWVKNIY